MNKPEDLIQTNVRIRRHLLRLINKDSQELNRSTEAIIGTALDLFYLKPSKLRIDELTKLPARKFGRFPKSR